MSCHSIGMELSSVIVIVNGIEQIILFILNEDSSFMVYMFQYKAYRCISISHAFSRFSMQHLDK